MVVHSSCLSGLFYHEGWILKTRISKILNWWRLKSFTHMYNLLWREGYEIWERTRSDFRNFEVLISINIFELPQWILSLALLLWWISIMGYKRIIAQFGMILGWEEKYLRLIMWIEILWSLFEVRLLISILECYNC